MDGLTIQVFGQLTDIVGSSSCGIDHVADTASLQQMLFAKYPLLKQKKFMVALNNKIVKENTPIDEAANIALLPPFSGG
jgi:molybdopterin converting factor small subunit